MNSEFQNNISHTEDGKELNLSDLFMFVHTHWRWFALSVIICLALAFLYIKAAPKEYNRSAMVLIRDGGKGGGSIGELSMLQDLGSLSFRSSVDNELLIFQAKRLIKDVVIRLHLDWSYTVRDGLRSVELYTQSPVQVVLPDALRQQELSFEVTPLNDREVKLSSFSEGETKAIIAPLRDTIQTNIGRIVITPTFYYSDIYYDRPIKVNKANLEKVALEYNKNLQVGLSSKQATIIQLSLTDRSIQRAEDVLNTIIAIYNEDAINDKNLITRNTSRFINERLIIIENELGLVDSEIADFMQRNQLTDIRSETGVYLQEGSMYSKEGLALENQISIARHIRDHLTSPQNSSDLIPANTGISDAGIETQIREYNTTWLKRNQFLSNSSNRNPMVMDLNNSLNSMKQAILRAVDNLIAGLNIQILNVESREQQTRDRITAIPSQSKQKQTIERQQTIKEELYLFLLNKREENELAQAITESNARIIDSATGSNIPVAPRSKIIVLAALLLGVIIPSGVLWLREVLNTTVRNRKDLEGILTMPFLGEIPERSKKRDKEEDDILVHENGRDSVSEAFRILRTNMDFMRIQAPDMKVITTNSAFPGSGKTFIATNLAMSLALTNKRVLLIDMDIRKRTLSTRIGVDQTMGITNYLSGQTDDIDSLICKNVFGGTLDVITSGPIPPNPSELLLNDRFDILIEELKRDYDYIILDGVPTQMIADAFIINRVVDLTMFIIRVGLFEHRMLPDLEQTYRQNKLKNMAIVLNGVDFRNSGYGYGYGYGYKYGYGYSHNDEEKD